MGPDPSDRRLREDDVTLPWFHLFCYGLLREDDRNTTSPHCAI